MGQSVHLHLIDRSFDKWEALVQDSGLKKAISFMKRSRLHFTRALSGHPLLEVEGVRLNGNGLPKWMKLKSTEGLLPREIRVILTLLTISRSEKLPINFDPHPISDSWDGALPPFRGREFHHALQDLGVKKWDWTWDNFHFSTKSGPNGQALATSMWDLQCLPDQLKDDLSLVGGRYIREAIKGLSEDCFTPVKLWYKLFPYSREPTQQFRKLSHFPDKEGKTRTIAIFDYWSQTVLRSLHNHLNEVLRRIPNDCTFNQDHFLKCLPSVGPYYSLDLTNATDRMPLLLQKAVLTYIIGAEKAEAWGRILCDWEFSTRGGPIKYNTGQPMGAYSSWPMMALTHHVIVKWAGIKAGKPHFRSYALLGDDIVIADKAVADKYVEILSALAMPISANKTHISDDTYEFAKRWIQKGVEVSPLSLSGIYETWSNYGLWSSFMDTQQRHGWLCKKGDPENFLTDILKAKGRYRIIPGILFKYQVFRLVLDFLRTKTEESADSVMHLLALPFPEDYPKVDFLIDLIGNILGRQTEREELALLDTANQILVKVRHGMKELIPDFETLQSLRANYRENNPILNVINLSHIRNFEILMKVKSGTPSEKLDCILSKDLVGAAIKLDIFSIRNSKSKVISQSILTTQLKREWQEYLKCENFL